VYINAKNEGKLMASQEAAYQACLTLIMAFSTVGIIALVDEATGYQEIRKRNDLQLLLSRILRPEHQGLANWEKRFNDWFYDECCRLKGVKWRGGAEKPYFIARLTADLVYSRIAPNLLEECRDRASKRRSEGKSRGKFHQMMDDPGVKVLNEHLGKLQLLFKMSKDLNECMELCDKFIPKIVDVNDLIQKEFQSATDEELAKLIER
jgi:hypothetical protein